MWCHLIWPSLYMFNCQITTPLYSQLLLCRYHLYDCILREDQVLLTLNCIYQQEPFQSCIQNQDLSVNTNTWLLTGHAQQFGRRRHISVLYLKYLDPDRL